MRIPFVAANWKMHKTVSEAVAYVESLRNPIQEIQSVEVALAPPFTAIQATAHAVTGTAIHVAGQDLHWESTGAYTGEISAAMLAESGGNFCLVGHSERRRLLGETVADTAAKLERLLACEILPIFCIGETLEERALAG